MKVGFLELLVILLSLGAIAQQSPDRVQFFGGYSYTGYPVYDTYSGPWERFGFNGWDASAAVKLVPHLAAEADFSGGHSSVFGNSGTLLTYMGGPNVFANLGRTTAFSHILFGELSFNLGGGGSTTTTSFAMAVGAGADIWFMRHIGARVIQADWLRNANGGASRSGLGGNGAHNDFRISTGVVFRFGH
jgi:hypothetical protein